jgi:iron complex transport system ATP-binding protein
MKSAMVNCKVLVARAQDTPLIILDEPTTHLDLLHKVALFKLLKKAH